MEKCSSSLKPGKRKHGVLVSKSDGSPGVEEGSFLFPGHHRPAAWNQGRGEGTVQILTGNDLDNISSVKTHPLGSGKHSSPPPLSLSLALAPTSQPPCSLNLRPAPLTPIFLTPALHYSPCPAAPRVPHTAPTSHCRPLPAQGPGCSSPWPLPRITNA